MESKEQLRNCVLLSHSGAGKTTLAEAMLYKKGLITRMGTVESGNTVSDYEEEEIKRGNSVQTSLLNLEWKATKINLIDTPGFADFRGEVVSGIRAADSALIVISASAGVEVGTRQLWELAHSHGLPRMIFVTKMDRENTSFSRVMESIQDNFGRECVPIQIPLGSESNFSGVLDLLDPDMSTPDDYVSDVENARERLVEAVAECDDQLAEKYLEGEELAIEELLTGLRNGVVNGDLIPVMFGSLPNGVGIPEVLNGIVDFLPPPSDSVEKVDGEEEQSAYVFKTTADPFVGKLSYFRVQSGKISSDSQVWNISTNQSERIGQLYVPQGKDQIPTQYISAGDIGAVSKLDSVLTGHTLGIQGVTAEMSGLEFPSAIYTRAVFPKTKADIDKLTSSLARITEEDPSVTIAREKDTLEIIMGGLGDTHLEVCAEKMERKFGLRVDLERPRVPYRETISASTSAEFKHKKQSGGAGQYGHVILELQPLANGDGFEFESRVVGGSVPREYIPSVEKGIRAALASGTVGGFPVTDLKATLVDGSFHSVDSSGVSFEIAASRALSVGMERAQPVLLEPVMKVVVKVPDEYTGDVIGDLNSRRGRILGMAPAEEGYSSTEVDVPHAEMLDYATSLRSLTQGLGTFAMEFSRYEETPQHLVDSAVTDNEELVEKAGSRN